MIQPRLSVVCLGQSVVTTRRIALEEAWLLHHRHTELLRPRPPGQGGMSSRGPPVAQPRLQVPSMAFYLQVGSPLGCRCTLHVGHDRIHTMMLPAPTVRHYIHSN